MNLEITGTSPEGVSWRSVFETHGPLSSLIIHFLLRLSVYAHEGPQSPKLDRKVTGYSISGLSRFHSLGLGSGRNDDQARPLGEWSGRPD